MKDLSLGSWAFAFGPYETEPVPLEQVVARLAEADYDGIELCGFAPHVPLDAYSATSSRKYLVRLLKDHGLAVSGYAPDLRPVSPVLDGNKDKYLNLVHRAVDFCAEIGSPSLRVDTGAPAGSLDDSDYVQAFDRLAGLWNAAADAAAKLKVQVLWEFEPGFVFNKPSEILRLHKKVAHPNFKLLFDTSHAYMCAVAGARQHGHREIVPGGLPDFVKKLEGRIGGIHLIDSDGTLYRGETSAHRPFGEGNIDFKMLAPMLLDISTIDWWCVDLFCCESAWDLIEPSRDFVLDLFDSKVAA